MKKNIFKTLALVFAFAIMLVPFINVEAEEPTLTEVSDEASLVAALENGGSIMLKNDIAVKKPLHAMKDATILGEEFTLSADQSFERDATGNGSLITVHPGATVTFSDITIVNSADRSKYGIQAYNTGIAVLHGVTIKDCKFGAILVNGGGLGIIDLTMTGNAYGIEFGKGTDVTENPAIVLMGEINGDQDTLLWLAEDDNLEKVEFGNMEGSSMTLAIDGDTLVLKDSEGKVVATSNEAKEGVTLVEQEIDLDDGTTDTTPEPTPSEPAVGNPDTADVNVITIAAIAIVGIFGTTFATKKVLRRN